MASACHARVEQAHYGGAPLSCVDCHGGQPLAATKEAAHPTTLISFNPATPGTKMPGGRLLAGASLAELDALDPAVLRFLNPSDYRVVESTCGSATRGGGNCHTGIAMSSLLSDHATLAGQLAGGLYFAGFGDRNAKYAVRAVTDLHPGDGAGTATSLEALPNDLAGMQADPRQKRFFAAFGQLCIECHLARDGAVVPGKYTSSGCNACHLVTADDSRPRTTDPTQDPEEAGHGEKHRLTNLIPDSQCNHCHHTHLDRGLLIQGVRERSEPDGDKGLGGPNRGARDPDGAVPWSAEHYVRNRGDLNLYGKSYPFYVSDEDGSNAVDETPPDIHFEKGLACIDCHTTGELHGGRHLTGRREFETRVRCQSCHGTPDEPVDATTLPFEKALSRVGGNANNPKVIAVGDDQYLFQTGKLDGRSHPVTQVARKLDPAEMRFNPRMLMGCGLHAGGTAFRDRLATWFASTAAADVAATFPGMPPGSRLADDVGARAGRLECFACHNAWTTNCYGCHMVRDDRESAPNRMTGVVEPGKISIYALSVVADALALGFDTRGRISPMVGTSVFFTDIDASGNHLADALPLATVDGFAGDGNQHNPVHHHTVRPRPRDCVACHPRADGVADDEEALKRVIGFGTGRFTFVDGAGRKHLLDRLVALDFDGDGAWDAPETTPLGRHVAAARPIAASTHMPISLEAGELGPGPLDRETINRMLGNPVVSGRPPP